MCRLDARRPGSPACETRRAFSSLPHDRRSTHPVGPAQVQIVAHDFFEELPAAQGAIEDLCQTDFHLWAVERESVPQRSRMGQTALEKKKIAFEALDNGFLSCAVAANFDEQRSEVGVVDVEIVVVDVDGLVAAELKLSVYFLPIERLRLLLGHSDAYDAVADLALAAELIGDVVLPFLVIELVKRYGIALGQGLYRVAESL